VFVAVHCASFLSFAAKKETKKAAGKKSFLFSGGCYYGRQCYCAAGLRMTTDSHFNFSQHTIHRGVTKGNFESVCCCALRFFSFFCGKERNKESRRKKKLPFFRGVLLWATVLLRCRAKDDY